MRFSIVFAIGVALITFFSNVRAQVRVTDLTSEISEEHIILVSAVGNGSSSGAAIDAIVVNGGASERHVNIHLSRPLYLVNSGSGQDMVASQVFLADGGYLSDGRSSFVTLQPRKQTSIILVAYCVDFDKENPTTGDEFSVGNLPSELNGVLVNIGRYNSAHPQQDITAAAQIAIWLAQGESALDIQKKFTFTDTDEQLARSFIP